MSLSSTMEVCIQCAKCGKWLKETEYYFYQDRCTECQIEEDQKRMEK